jgi:signal peptidase I
MKLKLLFILSLFLIPMVTAGKITYRVPIVCDSNSMYPIFDCHSKVYVETYNKGEGLKINDIVCYNPDYRHFRNNGFRYICHRIIDIQDKTYLTKGDNNIINDYYILERDIAFKVVKIE